MPNRALDERLDALRCKVAMISVKAETAGQVTRLFLLKQAAIRDDIVMKCSADVAALEFLMAIVADVKRKFHFGDGKFGIVVTKVKFFVVAPEAYAADLRIIFA